ncbi:MAG: bifunctional adenosylcobinamide kinase/adenosylcobinamide-phosphate guanylyltransferase [Cetobacterium sp.]|uniref:bifunctional adenosylcobinamide kinase/adenosylcobinamide-phosphate guanylyltransferase n=1 Tax=Cetobacterium sp. TaxID=2071632 RepID=UPI003F2B7FE5
MGRITYITGGSRSGKSSFAEKKILESERKKIYIATALVFDDEMKSRVAKHKSQRGENWKTLEAYKNLKNILMENSSGDEIILLDCLTNMVTNNMIMEEEIDWDTISPMKVDEIEEKIKKELLEFIDYIDKSEYQLIVVSNEIGMGLVPAYALGRYFRDICGRMNQIVAEKSQEAYFVVSGIPMKIK